MASFATSLAADCVRRFVSIENAYAAEVAENTAGIDAPSIDDALAGTKEILGRMEALGNSGSYCEYQDLRATI